jgi:hypothetical protein
MNLPIFAFGPLMRSLPVAALFLVILAASTLAAADPVADAKKALAGGSADEKRAALRALGSKDAGKDAEAYAVLISALEDRQAQEVAAATLAARSGESPSRSAFRPGADPKEIAAIWSNWFSIWQKKQEVEALKKKAEKKPELQPIATADTPTEATTSSDRGPRFDPKNDDLGRLARLSFTDGGSMLAYIRARRTDADGNLVSVQIIHRDGRGTETIDASLISRIDESAE